MFEAHLDAQLEARERRRCFRLLLLGVLSSLLLTPFVLHLWCSGWVSENLLRAIELTPGPEVDEGRICFLFLRERRNLQELEFLLRRHLSLFLWSESDLGDEVCEPIAPAEDDARSDAPRSSSMGDDSSELDRQPAEEPKDRLTAYAARLSDWFRALLLDLWRKYCLWGYPQRPSCCEGSGFGETHEPEAGNPTQVCRSGAASRAEVLKEYAWLDRFLSQYLQRIQGWSQRQWKKIERIDWLGIMRTRVVKSLLLAGCLLWTSGLMLAVRWLVVNRAQMIPGIPVLSGWIPWLGDLLWIRERRADLLDALTEQAERFEWRSFQVSVPVRPPAIIVAPRADNFEWILKRNFEGYVKEASTKDALREILGGGICNPDGAAWLERRKVVSPMLSHRSVRTMIPVFCAHSDTVMRRLRRLKKGQPVDLQDLCLRYTLSCFAEIAFGEALRAVEGEDLPFATAFDRLQALVHQRPTQSLWRLMKALRLGERERRIASDKEELDLFSFASLRKARAEWEKRQERPERLEGKSDSRQERKSKSIRELRESSFQDNLVFRLLDFARTHRLECVDDDVYLRDEQMNFLVAGRDTTATALSWTFYELSRHPEWQERLRNEIRRVWKEEGQDMFWTPAGMAKLRLTRAALLETIRLHPPVPMNVKSAVAEDVLPDGTPVPQGARVVCSPWLAGRCPTLWADPVRWDPGRPAWQDPKSEPSQYIFVAFSAGQRFCPGKELAILGAQIFLAKFYLEFESLRVLPEWEVRPMVGATLRMAEGLQATVKPSIEPGDSNRK